MDESRELQLSATWICTGRFGPSEGGRRSKRRDMQHELSYLFLLFLPTIDKTRKLMTALRVLSIALPHYFSTATVPLQEESHASEGTKCFCLSLVAGKLGTG